MPELRSAFITGAGGFIGKHLVRQLIAEGVEIVALMMPGELVPDEWGDSVRLVVGDVRTLSSLVDDIGKVDAVFHLAAVVSDWGSQQHHVDITVDGTRQAIDLACGWDAHFVVTTSVCAYASALAQGELTEDMPVGTPASPYEFCKQEQERLTREAVEQRQLKATIIRPGNVFGVGSGPWVVGMVEMLRDQQPCLLGSGDWDAGLCHVNNLVSMLIAAARSECTSGEVFNAADGYGVTWNTYLHRLAQAAGTPQPRSMFNALARIAAPVFEWSGRLTKREDRPPLTRQLYRLIGGPNKFSITRAQRCLDYKPVVNFEQAMGELSAHYGHPINEDRQPWVWVTGSASGLGRYLTGQLLQKGHRVLATDMDSAALELTAGADGWPGDRVKLEELDVTESAQWHCLLEKYEGQGVSFSHLLNVAGIIRPGFSFENTAQDTGIQLSVNVMGTVNGCDSLLPHFRARYAGHIINIASLAAYGPVPGIVGYCASKAAVRSFSNGLCMDLQLSQSPLKVSCVCPDLIATPMMDQQVECGEHSRVVFSGDKPLSTEEVGVVILRKVWERQPMEVAIKRHRGWIGLFMGLDPRLGLWGAKRMEQKGRDKLQGLRAGHNVRSH